MKKSSAPVRMNTPRRTPIEWLCHVICPLSPNPPPQLKKVLASCDTYMTRDVMCRAHIILNLIFPSSSSSVKDNIWAAKRRLEALKLYYRVLERLCRDEIQIFKATNLTPLLSSERFHRSILACSAVIVLAAHNNVTILVPSVLERAGITAFDLILVIGGFVKHEDSLPKELKQRLITLEERLLESVVWEKGSTLYNCLAVVRPVLFSQVTRLGLLAKPIPSLDALKKHETPSKGPNGNVIPPLLQSTFASPTRSGENFAKTGINIVFGKIVELAAVRINGMVERLQLSQKIIKKVYSLFQLILDQGTTLFFNRHIDHIILCCFYGIAQISQLNVTFHEIISDYKKQPQYKPQVLGDIITFYDEIFIHFVNALLVKLGLGQKVTKAKQMPEPKSNNDGNSAQSLGPHKISPISSQPDMSPKKISASDNKYVSPLSPTKNSSSRYTKWNDRMQGPKPMHDYRRKKKRARVVDD